MRAASPIHAGSRFRSSGPLARAAWALRASRRLTGVAGLLLATLPGAPHTSRATVTGAEPVAADPRALYAQIQASRIEPERAVRIEGVFLAVGPAFLDIETGLLFPASDVGGQSAELVFLGRARLSLEPPDEIEASQLELFTGSETLDVEIRAGVLVLTEKGQVDTLLLRDAAGPEGANLAERAEEIYRAWHRGPVRRLLGVESALFQAGLGDAGFQDYAAVWVQDSDLGSFYYLVDPAEHEPVTLGQFVPPELQPKETRKLEKTIARERRRGRLIGLEDEDIGTFDTWLSMALHHRDAKPHHGHPGFEAERYKLDLQVAKISQRFSGTAEITARAVARERKVLRLKLSTDLDVKRVVGKDGNDLFFARHGANLTVPLGATVRPGYATTVVVTFDGSPLEQLSGQRWVLRDTVFWYPQVSLLERASYDMKFTWPDRLDLVASGRKVEAGAGEQGMQWERRVQEFPVAAVSFELGEFRMREEQLGPIKVLFAFPKDFARETKDKGLEALKQAILGPLEFFQDVYGALPLQDMTVAFVDRNYSQGLFGFITMSTAASVQHGWFDRLFRRDPRVTFAHEVAHQWWGHLVGGESYRDQWISEAMANYSAILYGRRNLGMSGDYLTGPWTRWPTQLYVTTEDGRPFESIGPLVLGRRLNSSKAPGAYFPVVYLKGAMVMDMLSRYFRNEDLFPVLLGKLVERAYNELISTEDFLGHLARMSNTDLDWFSRQYIYGTGVPQIRYGYEIQEAESGEWIIEGWARQQAGHRYRYRVIQRPDGRLDVGREAVTISSPDGSRLVTPFQVLMEVEELVGKRMKTSELLTSGRVLLSAEEGTFRITLRSKPKNFWLDRNQEILAEFYDDSFFPRQRLVDEAVRQMDRGEHETAEKTFRRALKTPGRVEGKKGDWLAGRWDEASGMTLHLLLARLHLDQGRLEEAERDLAAVRRWIGASDYGFRLWFAITEARLQILKGEYDAAFRRLNRMMLRRGGSDRVEGYLLLAIAARELGRDDVLETALDEATKRGAQVELLAAASQ